jgi:hypothetical protein
MAPALVGMGRRAIADPAVGGCPHCARIAMTGRPSRYAVGALREGVAVDWSGFPGGGRRKARRRARSSGGVSGSSEVARREARSGGAGNGATTGCTKSCGKPNRPVLGRAGQSWLCLPTTSGSPKPSAISRPRALFRVDRERRSSRSNRADSVRTGCREHHDARQPFSQRCFAPGHHLSLGR